MPTDTPELIWTIAGLALLGVSLYMIGTRVIMPRIGSPWMSRREREATIQRGEALLTNSDLEEETRYQLQSRINTLRARGASAESWGGRTSERDVCREISEICERYHQDRAV